MGRVRIVGVEVVGPFRLRLTLSDGRQHERDFAEELIAADGSMVEPLRDPAFFAQVWVDPEVETVVWPNGYDMDPDVLIGEIPR